MCIKLKMHPNTCINLTMHPNTCIKLPMHLNLCKKLSIHSNMYTHIRHTHTFMHVRVHCTKFYSYGTYNKKNKKKKKFQLKGIVNGGFFEKFTFYLCDLWLKFCKKRANLGPVIKFLPI